jgi:hypothetical protein
MAINDTPWHSLKPSNEILQQVHEGLYARPLGQWIQRVYQEERHARGNWRGD